MARSSVRRPSPQRPGRLALAVALSLVGHGLFAAGVVALSRWPRAQPAKKPQQIALRAMSAREFERNRGPAAPAAPPPEAPEPKGKIVDVAPGNHLVPAESKFLAETNNRVRKETRSTAEKTNRAAAAKPHLVADAPTVEQGSSGGAVSAAATASGLIERLTGAGGARPRLLEPESRSAQAAAQPSAHPGQAEGEAQASDEPAEVVGGGASNDVLDGIAEGATTSLNTRASRAAAFFNRVKHAVASRWDPNGRLRNRADVRADKVTVLAVTIRPDGTLADVYVARSSGVDLLDIEAVQAFERAQPFPDVPPALVQDGAVRFVFNFNLSVGFSGLPGFPGR